MSGVTYNPSENAEDTIPLVRGARTPRARCPRHSRARRPRYVRGENAEGKMPSVLAGGTPALRGKAT